MRRFSPSVKKSFPMEILELKSLSRMVMPMPWCSPEITLMMKTEWLERRPVTSLVISRTNPKLAWPWQVARGPTIWNCTGLECRNPIYGKKYRKYFLVLIIHYFRTNDIVEYYPKQEAIELTSRGHLVPTPTTMRLKIMVSIFDIMYWTFF